MPVRQVYGAAVPFMPARHQHRVLIFLEMYCRYGLNIYPS